MKTQMNEINQLELKPESRFDRNLLKTIHKHLFNDESKWFVYWGDIEIDGEETEGMKISFEGVK